MKIMPLAFAFLAGHIPFWQQNVRKGERKTIMISAWGRIKREQEWQN